jgi:hypothetical protein
MTTFDDRERAFEKKYSMDQEFAFKSHARCNRLLGEWAAAKLKLSGPLADEYIKTVVKSDLAEPGVGACRKLKRDFEERGIDVTDGELRQVMAEFLLVAVRQLEHPGNRE